MPTVNATHRKRLARAFAAHANISYMQALDAVQKAAMAGALPSTLDDAGMQAALRILSNSPTFTHAATRPGDPTWWCLWCRQPLHVSDTQQWTPVTDDDSRWCPSTGPRPTTIEAYLAAGIWAAKRLTATTPEPGHPQLVEALADLDAALDQFDDTPSVRLTEHLTRVVRAATRIEDYAVSDLSDDTMAGFAAGIAAWAENLIDAEDYEVTRDDLIDRLEAGDIHHPDAHLPAPRWLYAATVPDEPPLGTVKQASDPKDQPIFDLSAQYEQLTGKQGLVYIAAPGDGPTKYVFGSTVALGRREALAVIRDMVNQAKADRAGEDRHYLIPASLRLLRQVWQGRVTAERRGTKKSQFRFAIDNEPATATHEVDLWWLHANGYITTPTVAADDEWVVVRTTDFGDEVLAVNGADTDKFRDGLPDAFAAAGVPSPVTGTGPRFSTVKFSEIQRCPIKSLEAGHYRPDGSCLCVPDPSTLAPFSGEGATTATVRGLLKVRDEFVKAGRVEWWWHTGPFAGTHGFKTVVGVDEEDGDLIFRDENPAHGEPVTRLSLDFIDDPDKAARHLIWPDHTGVTYRDKRTGEIDATYKVAPAAAQSPVSAGAGEPQQTRAWTRRAEPKPGSNEDVRQQLERQAALSRRISGWFKTQMNADPRPVRWEWSDKDAIRDSFAEIVVTYADGHHEFHTPGDFPDDNTIVDRNTDRLMGGPSTATIYLGDSNKRSTPRCDVCNRKLAPNEPWWMVHSPNRGWENSAGVVCGVHHPDHLPPYEQPTASPLMQAPCPHCETGTVTAIQGGTTGVCDTCTKTVNLAATQPSTKETPMTKPEKDLLALVEKTGGRTQVAGIVECRAALALADRGLVRIESGNISPEGGSGWVTRT